jgi:hypothetical protein
MKKVFLILVSLFFINSQIGLSQNTVGLLRYTPEKSSEGYNLFFPHNQSTTFLMDNCGNIVHTWQLPDTMRPGNAAYLLENGYLIRCSRPNNITNDPIWAGGGGQFVDVVDWSGDILHRFERNDEEFRLHHDVAPLPNGNILIITWEKKDSASAIAAGRNPQLLPQQELWSETILEWSPTLDSIVWQWEAWDHLVQDFDPSKANYGRVQEQVGKIDVNYDEQDGHPDWLHCNAIAYNPVLDQIVLSIPHFNEFWIIDHSTTTAEAKTNQGGNFGKGGELLYRWGNPKTYLRDQNTTQQLFFQHHTRWLNPNAAPDDPDFGKILLFNNRIHPDYSTGMVIQTPLNWSTQSYTLDPGKAFLPASASQIIRHPEADAPKDQSDGLSSIQRLENGNWLVFFGRWGYGVELTPENEIVWEYVVPLRAGKPVPQGTSLSSNNNLSFQMTRYPISFPAFNGKDLNQGSPLEGNPDNSLCLSTSLPTPPLVAQNAFRVYPNPAASQVYVDNYSKEKLYFVRLFGIDGQLQREWTPIQDQHAFDVSTLNPGFYLVVTNLGVQSLIINR